MRMHDDRPQFSNEPIRLQVLIRNVSWSLQCAWTIKRRWHFCEQAESEQFLFSTVQQIIYFSEKPSNSNHHADYSFKGKRRTSSKLQAQRPRPRREHTPFYIYLRAFLVFIQLILFYYHRRWGEGETTSLWSCERLVAFFIATGIYAMPGRTRTRLDRLEVMRALLCACGWNHLPCGKELCGAWQTVNTESVGSQSRLKLALCRLILLEHVVVGRPGVQVRLRAN